MCGFSRSEGKVLLWLVPLLLLFISTPTQTNVIPLEAAFQGRCEDGNPCLQNCYNIHNEMYECDCFDGFVLSDNGYSCLALNLTRSGKQQNNPSSSSQEEYKKKIAIQIEVNIDPPPLDPLDPSDSTLQGLGLSKHHVHYLSKNKGPGLALRGVPASHTAKQNRVGRLHQGSTEQLLQPGDIKVTYSTDAGQELKDRMEDWPARNQVDSSLYQNYESWNRAVYGDAPDPPRALPSVERHHHLNGDISDRIPMMDNDDDQASYQLDTLPCNLDCGQGRCFMERESPQDGSSAIMKRCLCPLGTTGEQCAFDHFLTSGAAHFSGHSWVSLPTLTHAYSDLQLSLEFKPEAPNGIILLTGETGDMTGDYLALLLRDGHVELRLDCGTGPGIVRTTSPVHLGRWNRLTVFRHDWGVWVQLNGGRHDEGRSQGLFSRITFAQPVVLGGTAVFLNTDHFLEMDAGYKGCIRNLEINNKAYNLNPPSAISGKTEQAGDALRGTDIDDCKTEDDDCQDLECQHQGACAISEAAEEDRQVSRCQCPLGFDGQFCENPVDVQIPSFDGISSYLIYPGLQGQSPLWNEFELVLRPTSQDGLILYHGDNILSNFNTDFLAIFLSRGFVEFAFDAGDGVTLVRSSTPLKLGRWHVVKISRTSLLAEIQVDDKRPVAQIATGAFTQVTIHQNLYLGGVPNFDLVSPYIPIRTPFAGCIQKLSINNHHVGLVSGSNGGVNVSPCWAHPCSAQNNSGLDGGGQHPCGPHGTCRPIMNDYTCECPLGLTGPKCEHALPQQEPTSKTPSGLDSAPAFTGDSFLQFNDEPIAQNIVGNTNTLNMRVKVSAPNGLLLWTGGDQMSPASDFLLLGVHDGVLHFRFNLGNGEGGVVYNHTRLDDGKWHRIRATRIEQTATLRVDNGHIVTGASPGKLRQLNGNGQLYIGGAEDLEHLPVPQFRSGLVGCISELSVGKIYSVNLLQRAKNGRNVDNCRNNLI